MGKRLISVVGPTAIGKTRLAIALARHFDTEIISADSRQFFKEMRIGTAVPTPEERAQAVHYFIQHRSIHEPYSVGDFEREAIERITEVLVAKDYVIMVGGSGLYVDAVVHGLDAFPKIDGTVRSQLNIDFQEKGIGYLQQELEKRDPVYYRQVDLSNPHRLIRALEVCMGSGRPYSTFLKRKKTARSFQTLILGITAPREVIYERINRRVDMMLAEGLVEEARRLYPSRELNALQTVGYKELFVYFDGHCSLDFAVEEIKKNTRRFAKRQLTWYRKREDILWVDYNSDFTKVIHQLEQRILAENQ